MFQTTKNNVENLPSALVGIYSEYREGKAGQEIGSEIDFLQWNIR